MRTPILRANTVNARSVIPGAVQVSPVNHYQEGAERKAQQMQVAEDRETEKAAAAQSQEREAYDKMIENPAAADMIAQQYGIKMNDNLRGLLKQPQQMKLAVDGAELAKNMGIANPQAARAFTAAFMQSGGNMSAAQQAINGMDLNKPITPGSSKEFGHYVKLGDGLYDQRTKEWVVQPGQDITSPSRDSRVPPDLRMQYEMIQKNPFAQPQEIEALIQKITPYVSGQGASAPPPATMPAPAPQANTVPDVMKSGPSDAAKSVAEKIFYGQ